MDDPSKNQASGVDDRFLGESMLRKLTNFGLERKSNQTKHWMPDSAGKECYDCQEKFTPFRRRHHCRICGLLFCHRCCSYETQLKLAGFAESNVRLCAYCSSTLLKLPKPTSSSSSSSSSTQQYLQSTSSIDPQQLQQQQYAPDSNVSENTFNSDHFSLTTKSNIHLLLNTDGEPSTIMDDVQSSASNLSSSSSTFPAHETPSNTDPTPSQQQQQPQPRSNNSNFCLKSLFNEIFRTSQGLQMQKQRYRLRTIECTTGKEIVDWLLKNHRASVISEAKLLCQCFLNETYLEPVVVPQTSFIEFKPDQTLYKLGKRGLERDVAVESNPFRSGSTTSSTSIESNSIGFFQQKMAKSTGVLIGTDLNYVQFNSQVANAKQDESGKKETADFDLGVDGDDQVEEIDTAKRSSPVDTISDLYNEYEELLLSQILIQYHVDQEWFPIILSICRTLARIVRVSSNTSNESTPNNDIRRCVKFKKLPGGNKNETQIVNGCVFTKNVIHRHMSSKIETPRVLLLKSQIEYQRSDDHRLTNLEPVLNQEQHYLYSYVDKLVSHLKPDILIVEKTVSRMAQDFLLHNGLILIYNVKENIMQRLAKCLCTSIMTSIDSRIPAHGQLPLGCCEYFQVKEFELNDGRKKRLMFFAGCPPENGCTVLIRGGTLQQLKIVKSVMRLFLLIAYSTQLEQAFLNDCHAQPMNNNDLSTIRQFDLAHEIETITPSKESILHLINDGLLLSTSLFVRYEPPYILRCSNQPNLSSELLYQHVFNSKFQQKKETTNPNGGTPFNWFYNSAYNSEIASVHDKHTFIKDKTLVPVVNQDTKAVYAHYRATGGRCHLRRRRWYDWLTLYQQQQPRDQPIETIFSSFLDLRLHLQIAILYSAHCTVQNKLLTCRQPDILEMPAYSIQDTTLGSFLEQHCFSTNDAPCKTCQQPLQDHVRQIVHGEMKLVIRIKHVDKTTANLQKIPTSNGIYMWSYCEHCRESSTKRLMSPRTWSLSFTKFLELLFHLESFCVCSVRSCQHHLFRDHYHYFHAQQFIASFRLFKIKLQHIYLPTPLILLKPFVHEREYYIELTKNLSVHGYNIFSTIVERLIELKNLNLNSDYFLSKLEQYLSQERIEQQTFRSLMDEIQLKMTAGGTAGYEQRRQLDIDSYVCIDDQIVEAKKFITKIVYNWNIILLDLEQFVKKYEKQQREAAKKLVLTKSIPTGEITTSDVTGSVPSESETSTISETPTPSSSLPSSAAVEAIAEDNLETGSKSTSGNDDETSRRSGVLKFFSNFLPNSDTDSNQLKLPFNDDEHLQLSGKYIVNHRELSSIIAHALSMSEYEHRLAEELSDTDANKDEEDVTQQQLQPQPPSTNDTGGIADEHQHIELQFFDSSTKFTVKVFHAAKFHTLRQTIFSNDTLGNGESTYIRSLSRCKKWTPRGGKSKSEFWQTFDDRFVLKDLNPKESLSFATFAPSYVDYMLNSLRNNRPTTLTKLLGVYHIQFRHSVTGENFKRDILVLENLFCDGISKSTATTTIYDLKGSMRNRLVVVEEGQTNAVLLDENFLTQSQDNPLYVRLHSKWTLMKALYADTQFLARHGVVDYSLLVCCTNPNDEQQPSTIHVGVIDYIRTYTWDKKIETIVKSMSGQGQSPTVISPEHYRNRFLRRMEQYFPVVPDEWYAYEKKYLDLTVFHPDTMSSISANIELPTQ